jgi:serine/threonine protein kinase
MIDRTGTVKIIDFGSTRVAGVVEASPFDRDDILGTAQYTAPEYFLGESGTPRSDLFSLGVITYQMLTGRLPYGAQVARTRTRKQQRALTYASVRESNADVPPWVDDVLMRAAHPDPEQRTQALSEYLHDLRHPKENYNRSSFKPLVERNPLVFWKVLSLVLACVVAYLLFKLRLHG